MNYCLFAISCFINIFLLLPLPVSSTPKTTNAAKDLSIEDSPVLQRWQRQVPNVLADIKNDPSFPRKNVKLGKLMELSWRNKYVDIFYPKIPLLQH